LRRFKLEESAGDIPRLLVDVFIRQLLLQPLPRIYLKARTLSAYQSLHSKWLLTRYHFF
jgi:hypothetical protein